MKLVIGQLFPSIIGWILPAPPGSLVEQNSLFKVGNVALGQLDHVRVNRNVVDPALDQEFGKFWVFGWRLPTNRHGLAVLVRRLDQMANGPLYG